MTAEETLRDALKIASDSLGTVAEHRVFHWIDRYLAGIDRWPQIDRMRDELAGAVSPNAGAHEGQRD